MKAQIQEDQKLETKNREPIPTSPLSVITAGMLQDAKARLKREPLGGRLQQHDEIKQYPPQQFKSINPSGYDFLDAKVRLKKRTDSLALAMRQILSRRQAIEESENRDDADDDWDAEPDSKEKNSRNKYLTDTLDWIIKLLDSGQLNDDILAPSLEADGFRAILRHNIISGALNLDKYFFSDLTLPRDIFEKLAAIVNYCAQAFKQISLTDNNLSFSCHISPFLSLLNLSQFSMLESINFFQKSNTPFTNNSEIKIFYNNLLKNTMIKNLQWNVTAYSEEEKSLLKSIEEHIDYNHSCAVSIAAYLILMDLLPKVLVESVVIEYLIGDKDYAPRFLKPVQFGENCMIFLNTNSKFSPQGDVSTNKFINIS